MTVRALRRPVDLAGSARGTDLLWGAGAALAAAILGTYAASPDLARFAFAFAFVALVAGVGLRNPRPLLLGLPIWLVLLGLLRRLLSGVSAAGAADPLLLVAPVALVVLVFAAADRGAFRRHTRLSKLVFLYSVATCLGAVNPLQPNITAGVAALIFFIPLLAFWIGRGLVDDALLRRVLLVIGVAAVPAAVYGMRQTFVGFPAWDDAWIQSRGYAALNVAGVIRPFATFSSAAEYATFIAVAMLVWLRLGPRRLLRPTAVAVAGLLAVAVFYQSSRGSVVMLVAGGAVMFAAWRGLPVVTAAVLGAALLVMLPAVVKRVAPATYSSEAASTLVQHQLEGLSNPFDPSTSTAGAHLNLMRVGIESAFRNPLGEGISSVTIAGGKFGGATNATEADPSNAAVALGLPGLVLFIGLFASGFGAAYRLARSGDALAGVGVGILTVTALQWLNGGQYAVAFVPWLLLGWVDARQLEQAKEPEPAVVPVLRAPPPVPRPIRPVRSPAPPTLVRRPVEMPRVREWNVFELERLRSQDHFERHVIISLRSYASLSGTLPAEFDPLVREIFADRLQELAR
jgi:hypothetical protein